MKTMYDIIEEKLVQSRSNGDKQEEKRYEEILKTRFHEIQNIVFEYDKADKIVTIDNKTIKFISYAENGACGCPGEMYIITKSSNEVKHYCFDCLKETPIESFHILLPWLVPFIKKFNSYYPNQKMFQMNLEGWKHCYLGLGNHLFVSNDIYSLFIDANIFHLMDTHQHFKLQMCWKSKAENILGVMREK